MAETQRKLVTRWGFQVDLKPLEKMRTSIAELKSGIKGIALEAAASAAALFETAETTATLGKQMSLAAQRAGMGVEQFQELAFAAKVAGVDTDGLTHAMAHMNRGIFEAKTGNKEAIKSFMMLGGGVAQAALSGRPSQEVFFKIADRIAGMKDQSAKAALAMQVFGRAGFTMLPMLNKGSAGLKEMGEEAQEMGLILDESAIAKSLEFKKALHETESLILGIKRTIGVGLLEPMTKVIKAFSLWIRANRELIKLNITEFFKGLGDILKVTLVVFGAIAKRVTELIKPLGGLGAAAKYAFEAFALFKGAQIVMALGNGLSAINAWIVGLALMESWSLRAFYAQVKAAAGPLLMVAGLVLLIALFEDLQGFFTGKDSLTGDLVEWVKSLDPIFEKFGAFGRIITMVLLTPLRAVITTIRTLGGVIGALVGGSGISGAMDAIEEGADAAAKPLMSAFSGKGFNLTSQMGFGDTAPKPGAGDFGPQPQGSQANIQNSITVTVPQGTDPHMVGDRVQDGVAKGLDNVLRPAHRALKPALEY
mgnify:CR=1 FL=1